MKNYVINNDGFNIMVEIEQKRLKEDIAKQYIAARKELKMTQEGVANASGIKRPNITRFERGDYNPTVDLLIKLAESLNKKLEIRLVDKEGKDEDVE